MMMRRGLVIGLRQAWANTSRALSTSNSASPQVSIVTGGAKGIGAGIVQSLAKGTDVKPIVYSLDCRVDVLVNNAGIQPVPSCVPLHELPDELWDKVLDVNLSGIFRMSKLVIPVMLKQAVDLPGGPGVRGGGVIINISSVQGLQSQAGVPVYAATKGGALSLTRQLAMEYGPHGLRVVAVNPGTVRTPLVADLLPGGGTAEDWAAAGSVYPLHGRVGEIGEIGDVCAFLASPGASFMTGCAIDVDGGIMAKGGWNT